MPHSRDDLGQDAHALHALHAQARRAEQLGRFAGDVAAELRPHLDRLTGLLAAASAGTPPALAEAGVLARRIEKVVDQLGGPGRRPDRTEEGTAGMAHLGGAETLLLADDHAVVRSVGQDILGRFGYRVVPADGGRAAVATFRARHREIDLVLLDLPLPCRRVRAVLHALRRIEPGVRVVICAALPEGPAIEALRRWGAAGVAAKPFHPPELARAVRRALDAAPVPIA